jgi:hypothetical protein
MRTATGPGHTLTNRGLLLAAASLAFLWGARMAAAPTVGARADVHREAVLTPTPSPGPRRIAAGTAPPLLQRHLSGQSPGAIAPLDRTTPLRSTTLDATSACLDTFKPALKKMTYRHLS